MECGFQNTQQPGNQHNHTLQIKHQGKQTHAVSISFPYMPSQTTELSTGLLGWDRRTLQAKL